MQERRGRIKERRPNTRPCLETTKTPSDLLGETRSSAPTPRRKGRRQTNTKVADMKPTNPAQRHITGEVNVATAINA